VSPSALSLALGLECRRSRSAKDARSRSRCAATTAAMMSSFVLK